MVDDPQRDESSPSTRTWLLLWALRHLRPHPERTPYRSRDSRLRFSEGTSHSRGKVSLQTPRPRRGFDHSKLVALLLAAATAQTARIGVELQVNSYTTGYQLYPEATAALGAEFVVVWMSERSPTDDQNVAVLARRFDGNVAQGADFRLNGQTAGMQGGPHVQLLRAEASSWYGTAAAPRAPARSAPSRPVYESSDWRL